MDEQMRKDYEAWREKSIWWTVCRPDQHDDSTSDAASTGRLMNIAAWESWQAAAALSQPAAQGDSSHPAGGECGGVPHPATVESFIGESEQADFDADTWTFKMQPGYSVGAGFYRISYIGLTAPKAAP